jgi:hypothetical protein
MLNLTGEVNVEGLLDEGKSLADYGVKAQTKIGIQLRINYYEEKEG